MPSPSSSLATLRPDLATFLEFDLESEKEGFISTKVFPVIDVQSASGNFGKIPIEQLLQQRETRRAPGGGYARGNWTFTPATYATVEHGAEEPVDDNEARMYAEYFQAEQISTMRAFSSVLRNAEQRVASAVFNTSTWTGSSLTTAVTTEWSVAATAKPITDVEAAVQKIYDNSGLWANALIINRKVFRNLRNCDQIIDRINASGAVRRQRRPTSLCRCWLRCLILITSLLLGPASRVPQKGRHPLCRKSGPVNMRWSARSQPVLTCERRASGVPSTGLRTVHPSAGLWKAIVMISAKRHHSCSPSGRRSGVVSGSRSSAEQYHGLR